MLNDVRYAHSDAPQLRCSALVSTTLEARMDLKHLSENGFAVIPAFSSKQEVSALRSAIEEHIQGISEAGVRGIAQKSPVVQAYANSFAVRNLVEGVLGANARLVRSVLFNKTPEANWLVTWHQDLSIAVRERADFPGFRGWSTKDGICHVQPPIEVLENMVTFRVHLDDAGPENGALVVSPGTHKLGRIPASEVAKATKEHEAHICSVSAGDALLFKPLLAHCSKKSANPSARRILHFEFCAVELPLPLQWATAA